jgi:dienelactone hydrolase
MRPVSALLLLLFLTLAGGSATAQERVRFASLDGKDGAAPTTLDAYLFRPDSPGPHPAIVFMHGCGGLIVPKTGAITSREMDWERRLVAKGFVVLMVDSFTPRGTSNMCSPGSFKEWIYMRRPADAYGALAYLQTLPFVVHDRIGVMGWSQGGGGVLYTVSSRGAGRPAGFGGPDFRAAVAFYPASCSERRQGAAWTTSIPLLILIGDKDVWTPAGPCRALADDAASRGVPVEFHAYPGAYHDFDWPGLKRRELHAYTTRDGAVPITGEDPAGRADALERVPAFLVRHILN